MKSLATLIFFVLFGFVSGQNIAINVDGSSPDPSALLELKSDNRGLLIPRMTTALRDAIISPAEALLIYNTDTECFNVYDGYWQSLCPEVPPASSCPPLTTDFGYFAIEQSTHTPRTFFAAVAYCKSLSPRSRLCSTADWYVACQSGLIPSMGSNDEWVDDFVHENNILLIGGNACDDTAVGNEGNLYIFRCCCDY